MAFEEYPNQWIKVKPSRSAGTGRRRMDPEATCNANGQLVLNHAAAEALGAPSRVTVEFNPKLREFILKPTSPSDLGGFALTGGGNSQSRISIREVMKTYPRLAGRYTISKAAGGIRLKQKANEDTEE